MVVASQQSAVRTGYKQTEVGMIPVEWSVQPLGPLVSIHSGESPSRFQFRGHGIPYFKVEQLNTSGKYQTETPYFVEGAKRIPRGSLIFPKRGASILLNKIRILTEDSFMDTNLMTLTPCERLDNEYLYYALLHIQLWKVADTTSIPQINNKHIKPLIIPVPPRAEQRAIAGALADVDALIETLDQLIGKKRDLKTATTQQLVTGKRRLPGFSEEWQVKKLGELLSYEQPTKYLVKIADYNDDFGTPVLTAGKTFILGYTPEETNTYQNLPTIIFDDFTTASRYVDFPFKAKSSAMKMLKPRDERTDARFVWEKMQLIRFPLGDHKRYWISEYQKLELTVPSAKEQSAISAILSDMDAEIAELEGRRDKARALKQAMMQQLLTGSIRLA